MSASYKTPGVYVKEISTLPASVAQVPTAIPAFVGYTEKVTHRGQTLIQRAQRIGSWVEFTAIFGGAAPLGRATVSLEGDVVSKVDLDKTFYLHDAIRLFFDNGGGDCYVVSVGDFDRAPTASALEAGLAEVARHDEPTLLVVPDAMALTADAAAGVQQKMLTQCADLGDRFAVLDVLEGDVEAPSPQQAVIDADTFRQKVGLTGLAYGAAYTPWLQVSYPTAARFDQIRLERAGTPVDFASLAAHGTPAQVHALLAQLPELADRIDDIHTRLGAHLSHDDAPGGLTALTKAARVDQDSLRAAIERGHAMATTLDGWAEGGLALDGLPAPGRDVLVSEADRIARRLARPHLQALVEHSLGIAARLEDWGDAIDFDGLFAKDRWGDAPDAADGYADGAVADRIRQAADAIEPALNGLAAALAAMLDAARSHQASQQQALYDSWPVYARIADAIASAVSAVPPSGGIAGCYARVDNDRGVWKAPANVSLNSVVGLTRLIDDGAQAQLNVDVNGGKSVNAIRAFRGRGILIWGARTLAGNDNEWRYVSTRRFFNMVEESVQKALAPLVFEPNDANTWLRVKAMIENYLNGIWRAGGLAGAKAQDAYFVNVGLGKTMTANDVLEGRMIVDIGMAAVRPAEFIILRFSHMMQSA